MNEPCICWSWYSTRYAHAVASRDWDLYKAIFAQDAVIDYQAAGGIKGNVEEVVIWFATMFGVKDGPLVMSRFSQHMVSNHDISFQDGHHATLRAMFYNPMAVRGLPLSFSVGGWYNHKLIKLNGTDWKSEQLWEKITYKNFLVSIVGQILVMVFVACKVLAMCRLWLVGKKSRDNEAKTKLPIIVYDHLTHFMN